MKKCFKIISAMLTSLLVFNTACYANSVKSINNNESSGLIFTTEKNLTKSIKLSDDLTKPIFIETENRSIETIASYFDIEGYNDSSIQEQECAELRGYLVYEHGDKRIEPWFAEVGIEEGLFEDDLENRAKSINSSDDIYSDLNDAKASQWPIVDTYSQKVSYTEGVLGLAGKLYKGTGTKKIGEQDIIVEITPRSSTANKYACAYYEPEIFLNNGKVIDYSPENKSSTTSVTVSYPWGVSASFGLGGTTTINKTAGGVGYNNTKWKFTPTLNAGTKGLKGKATCEFSSSISTLKSHISTNIRFKTTNNATGRSTYRTVNFGTSLTE